MKILNLTALFGGGKQAAEEAEYQARKKREQRSDFILTRLYHANAQNVAQNVAPSQEDAKTFAELVAWRNRESGSLGGNALALTSAAIAESLVEKGGLSPQDVQAFVDFSEKVQKQCQDAGIRFSHIHYDNALPSTLDF